MPYLIKEKLPVNVVEIVTQKIEALAERLQCVGHSRKKSEPDGVWLGEDQGEGRGL